MTATKSPLRFYVQILQYPIVVDKYFPRRLHLSFITNISHWVLDAKVNWIHDRQRGQRHKQIDSIWTNRSGFNRERGIVNYSKQDQSVDLATTVNLGHDIHLEVMWQKAIGLRRLYNPTWKCLDGGGKLESLPQPKCRRRWLCHEPEGF